VLYSSTVLGNAALSSNLSSKLDSLTIDIHQVLAVLRTPNQTSMPEASALEPRVRNNLEACARSAGRMVSSAATIVTSRSVSGSQTGSLFHDEMTEQQRIHVAEWIPSPTICEDPNEYLPNLETSYSIEDTQSSSQSEIFSVNNNETDTNVTSPMSDNKDFFQEYTPVKEVVADEAINSLTASMSNVALPSDSTSNTFHVLQLHRTPSGTTSSPTASPADKLVTEQNIQAKATLPTELAIITVPDFNPVSDEIDVIVKEWWRLGMLKYHESEYAGAELFLDKALKQSKAKYGTEFPERGKLFATLASTCAHQGKRDRVEQLLDEFRETAEWKRRVLELLLTEYVKEGKSKQAAEIFEKYGSEFEGQEAALLRLMTLCSEHSCWSVAASIITKHRTFCDRERALEICVIACLKQSKWEEAEGFLLELSKGMTGNQIKESEIMHSLAEVYFAKRDLKSAQLFCQRAIDIRMTKFGKSHPLFQESIYLIGKIIYEAHGDFIEFVNLKNLLPSKIQGTNPRMKIRLSQNASNSSC
jgi:tetratricopeptide (TPR) repeat protein